MTTTTTMSTSKIVPIPMYMGSSRRPDVPTESVSYPWTKQLCGDGQRWVHPLLLDTGSGRFFRATHRLAVEWFGGDADRPHRFGSQPPEDLHLTSIASGTAVPSKTNLLLSLTGPTKRSFSPTSAGLPAASWP
jgi:hypothetical protein